MDKLNYDPHDLIYYVEHNDIIRLIKEVSFSRAKKLSLFNDVIKKIDVIKTKNVKNFGNKDITEFKFYIIIEAKNLFDKEKYFKLFFEKKYISSKEFQEEHDKFLKTIKLKIKNKNSKVFKDLGKTNEVKGCYLIATNKTDKSKITAKNSLNTASVKFNTTNRLPDEIKEMCKEYKKFIIQSIAQEKSEMNKFNKMKKGEKENFIKNIVEGLRESFENNKDLPHSHFPYEINLEIQDFSLKDSLKKIKLEEAIIKNLDEVSDIDFLKSLMDSAIEKEDYEFCGKIRDRLKKINEKK